MAQPTNTDSEGIVINMIYRCGLPMKNDGTCNRMKKNEHQNPTEFFHYFLLYRV